MEEIEDPTEIVRENMHHQAAHGPGDDWIVKVALTSALLAVAAAVCSLFSGHYSNEAMLSQIRASNHWSHYQSKGIKAALMTQSRDIMHFLGKDTPKYDKEIERYQNEQDKLKEKAEEKEEASLEELSRHMVFASSVTLFQVAIGIAAISVLAKRKIFWYASMVIGLLGFIRLVVGKIL